jgi:hypothetical protein
MQPNLESIKQTALKINDSVNQLATQQGKATQTFDSAGNRTVTPPTTAIPVSAIETTAPAPLQMPTPQLPQVDIGGTRSAGQRIIDQETQRAQEAVARTEAPVTESERQIREMFGILGTESQARNQMEEQRGVNRFSQDLNRFQESLRNQIAQLDAFDLNNIQQNELARADASRRDITKRTFGAMTAEENIKNAVARAQIVSETRATIASIEATRGNLQAATEQVDKALKAIYEPVRMGMQMEMFFLERNDKRFDAAQKELANARMMGIERQFQEIDRAVTNVNAAVATGYASASDIEAMTDLAGNPEEQNKYAMNIIGRAARAEVAERQAAIQARIDAANQAMLAEQDEMRNVLMQQLNATTQHTVEAVSAIDRISGNTLGINASTGVVQSSLATGFAATTPFAPSAPGVATMARFIPGAGIAFNTVAAAKQKQEILGDLTFLVNDVTFSTMRRLKQQGVTFGSLTEGERIAIGKSADALFSALEVDDSGTVVGIRTSADAFNTRLQEYRTKTLRFQDEANIAASQMNMYDEQIIRSLQ